MKTKEFLALCIKIRVLLEASARKFRFLLFRCWTLFVQAKEALKRPASSTELCQRIHLQNFHIHMFISYSLLPSPEFSSLLA